MTQKQKDRKWEDRKIERWKDKIKSISVRLKDGKQRDREKREMDKQRDGNTERKRQRDEETEIQRY